MLAAEEKLTKKLDITEVLKILDQFNLFSKLFLNENQHYMLLNRDKQDIINKEKIENEIANINENKERQDRIKLIEYLSEKKFVNKYSPVDKLLYLYLENDIKKLVIESNVKI